MAPRRSTIFLATVTGLMLVLTVIFMHAEDEVRASRQRVAHNAAEVRRLQLTDLCLCTEASYTRHPTMADLATPFQDAPMSLEHFPTGAVVPPPPHLVIRHARD